MHFTKMKSFVHQFLLIILLSFIRGMVSQTSNNPIVEVPGQGFVKGVVMTSLNGRKFHGYMGIPYAKPPVGDLRFKEPQTADPFSGVWDGTHFGSQCLQYRHFHPPGHDKTYGQEDCLYLNVYTPKLSDSDEKKSLDVLITIHGGAFMFGSGEFYGPKYLLDRDVILVTINYRLGPLGFLSLEDELVPGNNGMKDQVIALRWVKDNIAAFGGNSNSVNLLGLSAGGASVHYHYLSPLSKDLFNVGISMSGTALCPWALVERPKEKALKLASIVGCPTNVESSKLLKCLRQRPATDIVSATSHFQVWLYNPFSPFGPVVEPKGLKGAFLPADPFDLLKNGEFQHKPWITGVTSHEGLYPASDWVADEELMNHFSKNFDVLAPHILHFNDTVEAEDMNEVVGKIQKFYCGDNEIKMHHKEEVIKICSDRLFLYGSAKSAKLQSNISPVYKYEFSYRGKYSLSDILTGTEEDFGVSHGDDISYVIDLQFIKDFEESDRPISELMLNLVTSFIRTGKPESKGVIWQQVHPKTELLDYLSIESSSDVKMKSSKDFGNLAFWDSLQINELHKSNKKHDEL